MRIRPRHVTVGTCLFALAALTTTSTALAQTPPANAPGANGTPPTDVTQSVAQGPAERTAPEEAAPPTDSTSVAVSAGGQYAAGNSRPYAATGQGKLDIDRK